MGNKRYRLDLKQTSAVTAAQAAQRPVRVHRLRGADFWLNIEGMTGAPESNTPGLLVDVVSDFLWLLAGFGQGQGFSPGPTLEAVSTPDLFHRN